MGSNFVRLQLLVYREMVLSFRQIFNLEKDLKKIQNVDPIF